MTLYVSVNWHPKNGLSILGQGLTDNGPQCMFSVSQNILSLGPYSSISRKSIVRARDAAPPRMKPQISPLEDLNTGLMEDHKGHTPYLPDNWHPHKSAGSGPSNHSINQFQKRQNLCLLTNEISTGTIPASLVKFLCCLWLACDFSS